ncbi:MAG: hypothetical protein JRC86_07255 [Deltaproteobacteria bacterium]|nr:hypothetical protein [Deltaproteobacteria bacterium]
MSEGKMSERKKGDTGKDGYIKAIKIGEREWSKWIDDGKGMRLAALAYASAVFAELMWNSNARAYVRAMDEDISKESCLAWIMLDSGTMPREEADETILFNRPRD